MIDTYLESLIKEAEALTLQLAEVQTKIRANSMVVEGEFTEPRDGERNDVEICLET